MALVGFWQWVLGRETTLETVVAAAPRVFEVDVPREVFGIETSSDPTSPVSRSAGRPLAKSRR